jgi:hypothetical protein
LPSAVMTTTGRRMPCLAKRFQDGKPIHARHLHVEQHAAL